MNASEMTRKERFAGYRILALAVLFSFFWHLFWLSTVQIVSPQAARSSQIRFSRVSFLGQIFAKVGMEVRAQPAERTLLEKRYNIFSSRAEGGPSAATASVLASKPDLDEGANKDAESIMAYLVSEAVSGAKAEPDYGSE